MPNFTKIAIKKTFKDLLNEKPIDKITVKDIVERCGINRNSFYYHFVDIEAVLKEIVVEESEDILKKYPTIDSVEQCLQVATEYALNNKKAVLHIYNSSNRDIYVRLLLKECEKIVTLYINSVIGERNIDESDRKIILELYKCECFGIIINWISSGMKKEYEDMFSRMCSLRKGMLEEMIDRCLDK